MPIFVGTNGTIPELLINQHNFWTYIKYITYIYPMQIIIALVRNGQNKYLCAPKNIDLNFTSDQYFQRAT